MTGEPTHTASEMAPRPPIIVWRVKYPLRFIVSYIQPITQHFRIKNCSKSTSAHRDIFRKKWCRTSQLYQLSYEKWSIHYASLLTVFNPLHNSMNQELFDKHLCYKNSRYEKYGRFPLREGKPSRAIAK